VAKAEQDTKGRFKRNDYSDDERYQLVRDVARAGRPDDPSVVIFVVTTFAVGLMFGWLFALAGAIVAAVSLAHRGLS
jgi:hypothetical protein